MLAKLNDCDWIYTEDGDYSEDYRKLSDLLACNPDATPDNIYLKHWDSYGAAGVSGHAEYPHHKFDNGAVVPGEFWAEWDAHFLKN